MIQVHPNTTHNKGFTLIELAVVLVIMGMLLSVGMSMVGPLTKRAKTIESKEMLNAAAEGVIGFAANPANGRLTTGAEFTTQVRNLNDSYGKPLQYLWSSNLASNICGRTFTNITVRECFNLACTAANRRDVTNVALVLLSSGENYNNQTAANSPATGSPAGTIITTYQMGALPPGTLVDNYAGDMNRPEDYDDIVKWVTLDELKVKMSCNASLRITNSDIPTARQGAVYPATGATTSLTADGGVPFTATPTLGRYSWCIETPTVSGLTFNRIRTAGTVALPPVAAGTCLTAAENTAAWGQADELQLTGTPTTAGSFPFTLFVRDNNDTRVNAPVGINNNDNVAQKSFSLTVNPSSTSFRIVTDTIPTCTQGVPCPGAIITADGAVSFYNPVGSNNLLWCVENTGGAAPAGLTFTPTFFRTTGNCLAQLTLNTGGLSPQVTIAATPALLAPGVYPFTIFVRDNVANITQKSFSLTVNPNSLGYRVWNSGGSRDFRVAGTCVGTVNTGMEITATGYLKVGQIDGINPPNGSCTGGAIKSTYYSSTVKAADANGDGCVNFNGASGATTDVICP